MHCCALMHVFLDLHMQVYTHLPNWIWSNLWRENHRPVFIAGKERALTLLSPRPFPRRLGTEIISQSPEHGWPRDGWPFLRWCNKIPCHLEAGGDGNELSQEWGLYHEGWNTVEHASGFENWISWNLLKSYYEPGFPIMAGGKVHSYPGHHPLRRNKRPCRRAAAVLVAAPAIGTRFRRGMKQGNQ